jgi:hypothetical protein
MATSRTDPYLWLHLSGLATVPLWLDGCLAGLAVGDPSVPSSVEIALLAMVGIVPVLVMQWQRPFYLFSLLVIAVQPVALTPAQRQLLRVQRHWFNRVIALAIAAALGWLLVVIYQLAPIASDITPFTPWGHTGGWLVAAGCFWGANLFLQVSVSALRLLMARPQAVAALEPYPVETISQDFTVVGLRLKRILPPSWVPETASSGVPDAAPVTAPEPSPAPSEEPLAPETAVANTGPSPDLAHTESDPEPLALEDENPDLSQSLVAPSAEHSLATAHSLDTAESEAPLEHAAAVDPELAMVSVDSIDGEPPSVEMPDGLPEPQHAPETPKDADDRTFAAASPTDPAIEAEPLEAADEESAPLVEDPVALPATAPTPDTVEADEHLDRGEAAPSHPTAAVAPDIDQTAGEGADTAFAHSLQQVETLEAEDTHAAHGVASLLDVVDLMTSDDGAADSSDPTLAEAPSHHCQDTSTATPTDELVEVLPRDQADASAIAADGSQG